MKVAFEQNAVLVGDAEVTAFHLQADDKIYRTPQDKCGGYMMLFTLNQKFGSDGQAQSMLILDGMNTRTVGNDFLIQVAQEYTRVKS